MNVTILALDRAPRPARCAFDRKSVREYDRDGRLHVAVSNMAKEAVDQYLGEEIPGWDSLGLDPKRIYRVYRPGEELEKAVATFNNLPILRDHIPVSAEAPQQDLVIGSTGTDAVFEDGFIRNSAVIWVADDIDDIESETKREWSPGYYYTPIVENGNFNGVAYDVVMRDIVGNHVALVDEGRQGRDVVVADRQPETLKMIKSKRALMLHGAIAALIAPKLAQDSKVNLTGALRNATAKNRGKDADKVAAAVVKLVTPKLAQDEGIDVSDVVEIIRAVDGVEGAPAEDEDNIPEPGADPDDGMVNDADGDVLAKVMQFLEGKLSDEDMAALGELVGGGSEEPAEDEEPGGEGDEPKPASEIAKPAMDRKAVGRMLAEIRQAERDVAPHIGEVTVAMDSASAVYRLALDAAGVDLKGVPASAFKAMVALLPKPGATAAPVMAADRKAAGQSFADRFPEANNLIPS